MQIRRLRARSRGDVGIAKVVFGRDGLRFRAGHLPVEAVIGIVTEIDDAVKDGKFTPAIFVGAGSDVIWRGRDVFPAAGFGPAHNDAAALLLRSVFGPVDGLAVEGDLSQADAPGQEQVGGDRRLPGAIGGDSGLGHSKDKVEIRVD
jgi:hypothetical protein